MKSSTLSLGVICALLMSVSFPMTSIAEFEAPTPLIHITQIPSTIHGQTTYVVELLNTTTLLNVFEFEVLFASADINIESLNIVSSLCQEQFIIENHINTELGSWYVACGTTSPIISDTITLATFSVESKSDRPSALVFGPATRVYQHDGKGTKISPLTIGTVHRKPAAV